MEKLCAWCKKKLGTVYSDMHPETIITHGICDECSILLLGEQRENLMELLDNLTAPVVVIDMTGTVKTANRQARNLLDKDLPNIEDYQPGDVFECVYSKLEEGCGNTTHCSGCTIRRTIMDTYQSGKSHLNEPTFLNGGTLEDIHKTNLLISTEKVGDVVLLRIDKLGND